MRKEEFQIVDKYVEQEVNKTLAEIISEIESVRAIMNEQIIEHNRNDLINFINGLNQCLCIVDRHMNKKEE